MSEALNKLEAILEANKQLEYEAYIEAKYGKIPTITEYFSMKECSFYECYEPTYKSSMNCQYHQPVKENN
jgi:hypothetical protein